MHTFTVFTPTFNRATTLHRVFDSLQAQTFRDFEWLIVDDGSTDGTATLIERFHREASFPLRYVYQPNRGKHVAFNHGVRLAQGKFFLSIDSDDAMVPEALQVFNNYWEAIPEAERDGFTGVCALTMNQNGQQNGSSFPQDVFDAHNLDLIHRHRMTGEKFGFHRTAVLRQFPFPEIPGLSFIPEGVVWGRIGRKYRERFINVPLRIYFRSEGTRRDQISLIPFSRNARAKCYASVCFLNERLDWLASDPVFFIKEATKVSRAGFHAGLSARGQWRRLHGDVGRLLWLLCLPVGIGIYLIDLARDRLR